MYLKKKKTGFLSRALTNLNSAQKFHSLQPMLDTASLYHAARKLFTFPSTWSTTAVNEFTGDAVKYFPSC